MRVELAPTAAFDVDRVERTLLSVGFDFDLAFDFQLGGTDKPGEATGKKSPQK